MSYARLVAVIVVYAVASASAKAQRNVSRDCKPDTASAWYSKQRAWLDDSKHGWSDDALRTELLRATGLDQTTSAPIQLGWEVPAGTVVTPDQTMITQLRTLATTRGSTWPTKSVAGAMGTRAVWLLTQHDTGLARAALKRMMEAGPEESNAADVATLEDRMRLQSGRKQIYGTQFRVASDGKLVLAPMEDSAHVDLRREDAGLPPFKTSACLAKVSLK